ncbi:DinB family protein [Pedobacter frigidisoli]|uniref:DinB family protein n=1 Tax=Pedobacter frigidisoli TaxID=2530455 RepID=A0A4R0NWM0_9SPHI|nr:DinB family protein [Pedobacter frigidisoli]TCD04570.1 DinB family protein [Pedobacter frigidisoli]
MVHNNKFSGAIAALLDEYKKAIDELIKVIEPLTDDQLIRPIEPISTNTDCHSIQTILTHVTSSMFSYAVYIENSVGLGTERPERLTFDNASAYISRLEIAFDYTKNVFVQNPSITLEELDSSKKITTRWGQLYDVEQILEHAIVHILRHRRQIEKACDQYKFSN